MSDFYDVLRRLEEMFDILETQIQAQIRATSVGSDPDTRRAADDAGWSSFLDEHQELTETEPLVFTDEQLVAAVPEAIRQNNEHRRTLPWDLEPLDFTWSNTVAGLLATGSTQGRASRADVIRVGRALGRLSRANRVRRVERPRWEHGAAFWQPVTT